MTELEQLVEAEMPDNPGIYRLQDGRPLWKAGVNDSGLRRLVALRFSSRLTKGLRGALDRYFQDSPIASRLERLAGRVAA